MRPRASVPPLVVVLACSGGTGGDDDRRRFTWDDVDDPAWCRGPEGSPTADRGCGCTADCDAQELCLAEEESGYPGGTCIRSCNDGCPDGTACSNLNVCLAECASTADCRPGYFCSRALSEEGRLLCSRWCQSDADCVAWETCDPYTGFCGEGVHPGQGAIGTACTSDYDCLSGICGTLAGVAGGFCSAICVVSRQGCPDDAYCIGQGEDDDDFGACYTLCDAQEDCLEGFFCGEIPDGSGLTACGAPPG
jgi:hypothetical protein